MLVRSWQEQTVESLEDDNEFGEWIYEQISRNIILEEDGPTFDLVQGVAECLNTERYPIQPIEPVILQMPQPTAFVVPGRYLYISRALLQTNICEEAVAFVMGHEMAHHDLGHTAFLSTVSTSLRNLPGGMLLINALRAREKLLNSPEWEQAADRYGLELCIAVGYDGLQALQIFDVLEAYALKHGDVVGVFGPEESVDDLLHTLPPGKLRNWLSQTRTWAEQRSRGYPPLRNRKETLLGYL